MDCMPFRFVNARDVLYRFCITGECILSVGYLICNSILCLRTKEREL